MIKPRSNQEITIRSATDADRPAVAQLARLDSSRTLHGDALLAFVDGDLRAAISLQQGVVVADPFQLAEDAIAMLRLRAAQRVAAA